MLNQIILVEKTKFVSKLFTSIFEEKELSTYNLDSIEDFSYLIDDLSPQLILVEIETAQENWDLFWNSIENAKFKDVKLVLYGEQDLVDICQYKDRFDQVIYKPIDVLTIYDSLSTLVE